MCLKKILGAVKAYEKNNFTKDKLIKKFLLDKGVYKGAFLMSNYKSKFNMLSIIRLFFNKTAYNLMF